MPRVCSFAVLLVAIMFGLFHPVRALDDWQPILPEELKMTADSAHQGDAIMLYHEEISNDNTRHAYVYKRVKILTEKGRDLANVEIPYNAAYVGISDIKARTIAPDGTITPFTGKAFDTARLKAHGIKYLAKTFTLPNVQVGSIIEWKYTEYWDRYFFAAHWAVQEDLYQKHAKFVFIPYLGSHDVVDYHGDIQDRVFYTNIGLPPDATIKTTVNSRMELEMKDIQAFEPEPYEPPAELLKMRVNFYYGTEKMRKPAEFWKEQGKYWSQDADSFMGHYSSVAAAANQAVSPADTPEQKVRKIYAQIQHMRNLTYSDRESRMDELLDQENNKEKRTLEDVLRKNEGHRDELTRLFVAMVRAVKIPAFVMRVSDRDETFFQPTIPNPRQLTSEIAIVVIDGKEVFLDPGTPLCPFAQLKWQHTATQGIRQTSGGSAELAKTEAPTYKDAVSKRVGRVTLTEDGGLNGKVFLAWTGEEALIHRLNAYRTDEAGRKKDLESELKAMLPSGSSVQLDSVTGGEDAEQQLIAAFRVEIPAFASRAGKRLLVPATMFEANLRPPFAHGERKNPIYFDYPYYVLDDVQISLPTNLRVESVPQTQPIKSDFAFYDFKRTAKGNVLALSRDFAMGGIAFLPKDYDALRSFFAGVASGDSEQVVLTTEAK
jgi:hypothetical protein